MELILGFIVLVVINILFRVGFTSISSFFTAMGKSASGKGNFSENFKKSFNVNMFGFESFQMRVVDREVNLGEGTTKIKDVEVKGGIPIDSAKRIGIYVSILDTTESPAQPVLSILEDFREVNTPAFQIFVDAGTLQSDQGYPDWVRLGGFFPELLETPYKGVRSLSVFVRLVDLDNPVRVRMGYHQEGEGLIWANAISFDFNVRIAGYKERVEQREEAHCTIIKLAVFAALADNNLHDDEGNIIRKWILQTLYFYSEERYEELKSKFNNALKNAYEEMKKGTLVFSTLCETLNEINEDSYKYEAVELCYDVVAADNEIRIEEAEMVDKLSKELNLDKKEIEKIKDKRIIGLGSGLQKGESLKGLLGIDENMSTEEVNSHLRKEFQKWNSRLNTLPEGKERENAQKMLDLISKVREDDAE